METLFFAAVIVEVALIPFLVHALSDLADEHVR